MNEHITSSLAEQSKIAKKTVIKRNGKIEQLTKKKIYDSIVKANDCVADDLRITKKQIQRITDSVFDACQDMEEPIPIDSIEDMIEKKLMSAEAFEVAKKYITYRYEKERVRNIHALTEKLTASNVVNQNANIDEFSFGGRLGEAASYVTKEYALSNLLSEKSKRNHLGNEIYIHDLDHYALGDHNCVLGNSWVTVKTNNDIRLLRVSELASEIGLGESQLADLSKASIYIMSRDGWTRLVNMTARKTNADEALYTVKTRTGIPLTVTADHRLPVITDDGETVKQAKDLKVGDCLLDVEQLNLSYDELNSSFLNLMDLDSEDTPLVLENLTALRHYLRFKYGVVYSNYAKSRGFKYNGHDKWILVKDFKQLMDEYPVSFDVLSKLRLKALRGKRRYPLFVPYTPQLAKLYAYVYADGGVYWNPEKSAFQLTFTNVSQEIMDDFVNCYESCFGYRLKILQPRPNWNSPCKKTYDCSSIPCMVFRNFAGARKTSAADISMPDFVVNGGETIQYAYLAACIDTDGSMSDKSVCYVSACERYRDQLFMMLERLGYHPVTSAQHEAGTTYRIATKTGTRNYDYYKVEIIRNDEKAALQAKCQTFKYNDTYVYKGLSGKFQENRIVKISSEVRDETVYDFETESHWFIVNNYVSHNCLSIPFDHLLKNGFSTRQTDIRPAGSINTALQLVAVIFQLQSLQQFGGVSATHLDWTMVPYIRLSFHKHYFDGLRFIDLMSKSKLREEHPSKSPLTKDEIRELSIDSDWYNHDLPAYKYAMEKTLDELNQAVEGMYHNLNSLQSRSGCQLPFTSINYGTCTLPEGRMVIKALLEGSISGVGKFHKTSIFPCGIFQCMAGVNRKPGDPNYDLFRLALKSTSTRLYPNFGNCDWITDVESFKQDREGKRKVIESLSATDYAVLVDKVSKDPELADFLMLKVVDGKLEVVDSYYPFELASFMGCRTYNGLDINALPSYVKNVHAAIEGQPLYDDIRSGVQKDGRGNISPVTVILPTLAMQAKEKAKAQKEPSSSAVVEEFMKLLDQKIHEAKDMLLERFDWQCSQPMKSAKFMYQNRCMSGYAESEGIKSALRHGTLVIGQIGLAETLQLLIGKDQTTDEGMELAKRIEQLYKDRCAQFKKDYKLNFGVYATPAENLCYTSMSKFKEKYGEIPNVSDKKFFTNSIHVPVWVEVDPFKKIDIESQLLLYTNAGIITYVELPASTLHNIDALDELVNYAMDKEVPYLGLNLPSDTCLNCGYQGEIGSVCPQCGSGDIERLRRVTGYLSSDYRQFNLGKQDEVTRRVKHSGIEVSCDC